MFCRLPKYAAFLLVLPLAAQATPQNVIIVIGDGMGPAQEEAAGSTARRRSRGTQHPTRPR